MRRLAPLMITLLAACSSSHGAGRPRVDAASGDAGVDASATDGSADTSSPACPVDVFAAIGSACAEEGQICGDCPGDPCSFCNQLYCSGGAWTRIEAFPAPCHDCGGAGPCVSISQYCDIAYSDVVGFPDSYQCLPLPTECLGDLSCACLQMSIAADRCSGMGTTGLTVEHLGG